MIRDCNGLTFRWEGDARTNQGGEGQTVMPQWFHDSMFATADEQRVRQSLLTHLTAWLDSLYAHDNIATKVYERFKDDPEVNVTLYVQATSQNICWFSAELTFSHNRQRFAVARDCRDIRL